MIRLAILDDYQDVSLDFGPWGSLSTWGVEVSVFNEPLGADISVVHNLAGYDIIIAMRERTAFPRSTLQQLERLKLLVTTSMVNAAIDMDAARDEGIVVCGTPGSPTAAPEHTWALLLAFVRDIASQQESLRAGNWQTSVGSELNAKTIGLVGLGKIGSKVAEYAKVFGMEALAWSPNLTPEKARARGVTLVSKDELLASSDFVSLHLRLADSTTHIIGERDLRRLGSHGVLINTARAHLVDQQALVRALNEGLIGGAVLDVFDLEPIPRDHPLLLARNTLLTPHLGYVTQDNYAKFYAGAVENVVSWLKGYPIRVLN